MSASAAAARRVLILGGGIGGVVAAHRLRALLPRRHEIVLIERESHHTFQPSLLWLAVGKRQSGEIRRPIERLRRKGIEVVVANITGVDPVTRSVTAGDTRFTGDALVVALGADLDPDAVPGLAAAGHNLYTVDGAAAIAARLPSLRAGRVVVLTATPRYKCPAAPYEAAMLIEAELRRRGVRRGTTIDLYAAEPGPMGVAGPDVSAGVRQLLQSKNIAYHPEHQVVAADAAAQRLHFANGTTAEYDLLIYVPPHRAPAVVAAANLTDASGWIPANRQTFETAFPGVYAIGDVTTVPLVIGKPLPKAGVFAHAQAEVVAANIASSWSGAGRMRAFDGHGQCFLESGDGRAGLGSGNFYGEPAPRIRLRGPSRWHHWGKVAFEKYWLFRWF